MAEQHPHPTEIRRGLEEMRVRWRLVWFVSISLLVVFIVFAAWAIIERRWEEEWREHLGGLALSTLVMNIAWLRAVICRCPRCGEWFYWRSAGIPPLRHILAGRCVHCAMPLRARARE